MANSLEYLSEVVTDLRSSLKENETSIKNTQNELKGTEKKVTDLFTTKKIIYIIATFLAVATGVGWIKLNEAANKIIDLNDKIDTLNFRIAKGQAFFDSLEKSKERIFSQYVENVRSSFIDSITRKNKEDIASYNKRIDSLKIVTLNTDNIQIGEHEYFDDFSKIPALQGIENIPKFIYAIRSNPGDANRKPSFTIWYKTITLKK